MKRALFVLGAVFVFCALVAIPRSIIALEDADPPTVTSFSVSPAHIDTAEDPQEVTISITLTDDLTGVAITDDPGYDGTRSVV